MQVTVKLYAGLRRFGPEGHPDAGFALTLPEGAGVAELLRLLGVPENAPVVAMVNQQVVEPHHLLAEGDVLALFPPVAGG